MSAFGFGLYRSGWFDYFQLCFVIASAAAAFPRVLSAGAVGRWFFATVGVQDQRKDGPCETCVQECAVNGQSSCVAAVILSVIGGTL